MSFIDNWLRPQIRQLDAYKVAKSAGLVKLDAMESPFSLDEKGLNRYPDPDATELKNVLRELLEIPTELDILLGNGSDELIQLLALAADNSSTILGFEPSFVMYKMIADFCNLDYQTVALNQDFEIDLAATLSKIDACQPKLIFISYPNNPTGNTFSRASIIEIITKTTALVVIDEAYYAYADDSFLPDVSHYPNLVLLRTVSKVGFAGLRLGALIGAKSTISQLNKLRLPYNINTLTQQTAVLLLQKKSEIIKNSEAIISLRIELSKSLAAIAELKVYPSQANFILFQATDSKGLFAALKQGGVLIKDLSSTLNLGDCLRVTIGTFEENQRFLQLTKKYYD